MTKEAFWGNVQKTVRRLPVEMRVVLLIIGSLTLVWMLVHLFQQSQPTSGSIVNEIKDASVIAAAFIGMWVGVMGISTWRRQLHGSRRSTIAEEVLKSSYEAKSRILPMQDLCEAVFSYCSAIEQDISYTPEQIEILKFNCEGRSDAMIEALSSTISVAVSADAVIQHGHEDVARSAFQNSALAKNIADNTIDILLKEVKAGRGKSIVRPMMDQAKKAHQYLESGINQMNILAAKARETLAGI
jgi:hypothetical protein